MVNETKASPAPARAPTQKEEGQLGPDPFRERLVQNGVRQLLGPEGLLLGHGERQLAPRIRTRTLLSSCSSGVMRPAG